MTFRVSINKRSRQNAEDKQKIWNAIKSAFKVAENDPMVAEIEAQLRQEQNHAQKEKVIGNKSQRRVGMGVK